MVSASNLQEELLTSLSKLESYVQDKDDALNTFNGKMEKEYQNIKNYFKMNMSNVFVNIIWNNDLSLFDIVLRFPIDKQSEVSTVLFDIFGAKEVHTKYEDDECKIIVNKNTFKG